MHPYLLLIPYAVGLFLLGYCIPRSEFWTLFSVYSVLFGVFSYWVWRRPFDLKWILLIGILGRLLLFGMMPNWSDDVHRFVWDGRIVANGGDPYADKPQELLGTEFGEGADLDSALFKDLNSPDYYSVYPPVDQYAFAATALIAGKDLPLHALLMRGLLFLADIAIFILLVRLLIHFGLPPGGAMLYFLNPLVILEGVGNLHFEPLMLAFLLASLWFVLVHGRWFWSGILYGLAVSTKLIPLIFLPFFIRRMGWRSIPFFLVIGGTVLLSFLPWISFETIEHFGRSLNLYFQSFEFNGSIYSLVRWMGFQWVGYNIISTAGPLLSTLTLIGILTFAFIGRVERTKELFSLFLLSLTLHLLFTTTVHPWYLLPLLVFLPFVPFRYPLAWSFLVVLSYSAYSSGATIPLWILSMEYGTLFIMILYELLSKRAEDLRGIFKKVGSGSEMSEKKTS